MQSLLACSTTMASYALPVMRTLSTQLAALLMIWLGTTACDRQGWTDQLRIPVPQARVPEPVPSPEDSPCEPGSVPASADFFPERIDLGPGETATIRLHVVRNGYCGPIEIAVPALPAGVHAELEPPAPWPATVTTVRLTADETLSDFIGHVRFHAWVGYVHAYDSTMRTRSTAEPDWADDVVGIPETETGGGSVVWVDENRFVFVDIERDAPGYVTPVIRCIEPGLGRCGDFAHAGSLRLTPRSEGHGSTSLALAPDGSFIVAEVSWDPVHISKWGRVSPFGEWTTFEGVDPAAIETAAEGLEVDALGRILFLARPTDWPAPSALVRLNPDGSLDDSFGEGGFVSVLGSVIGAKDVHALNDGRILLDGHNYICFLDEQGTALAAPTSSEGDHGEVKAISDGSVLVAQFLGPDEGDRTGSVTLFDAAGAALRRWELGVLVKPLAFGLSGSQPVVVGEFDSSGLIRVIRLPPDREPQTIAERFVGTSAGPATASESGPLVVAGSRSFRLPDGGTPWREVFFWQ